MNSTRPWSRTGLLLVLASLILATAAGAADRMPDVTAAPTTIEGLVSSVAPPVVKLADGLIAIDASTATVSLPTGKTGTLADVKAGSRVVIVLRPGSPPTAQQVLVTGAAGLVDVQGAVEAVDASGKTFAAAGITFKVTSDTSFGGPRDGSGTYALTDLRVGDPVRVSAGNQGGALTAARVLVLGRMVLPGERLQGTVKAIGTESWTLTVDGKDRTVLVNPQTKVVGDPKVGDEVDVLAQPDAAGNLIALLIAKHANPLPTPDVVSFDGVVKSIGASAWTITTERDGDVTVAIGPATKVEGAPAVGDRVKVAAQRATGGGLTALLIVKVPPTPPAPSDTSFEATVKAIGQASWTFVDDKGTVITVAIAATTRIGGDPKVGDRVRVLARKDGATLVAVSIMKVMVGPNPGPEVSFEGTVKSIDVTRTLWVIGDVKVLASPMTRIDGSIKVGDTVLVKGMKSSDGSVLATEIRKK
jgi:hypothetical protein